MKSIVFLLVLILALLGGYSWYNSSVTAKKKAEARQRIEAAESEITKCGEEIDSLNERLAKLPDELSEVQEEHDRIEQQIAENQSMLSEKEEAQKELRSESARLGSNSRTTQVSRSSRSSDGNVFDSAAKRLVELECHFNCMQRSKRPKDSSDRWKTRNGTWFRTSQLRVLWRCSKHGFVFEKSIEYLDYKRDKMALEREISQAEEAEKQRREEEKKQQELIAQREKRSEEIVEQRKTLQAEILDLKTGLNKLSRELRKCKQKISQLESEEAKLKRDIERLNSKIEEKRKAIEKDKKIAG